MTKRKPAIKSPANGFTILEVLLAIMVISLLALPLWKVLNTEKRVAVDSRDRFAAGLIAGSEMEALKALSSIESLRDDEYAVELNRKYFRVHRFVNGRFEKKGALLDSASHTIKEIRIDVLLDKRTLTSLTGLFGGK